MTIKLVNTTRIPTPIVRDLVHQAAYGVPPAIRDQVEIVVKPAKGYSYKGFAWRRYRHPARYTPERPYLIELWISTAPSRWPASNVVRSSRGFDTETDAEAEHARLFMAGYDVDPEIYQRQGRGANWHRVRYYVDVRHGYGGLRSPVITCQSWQEGLVALAAHELRHTVQFVTKARASEVDCERVAAKALARYRKARP